MMNMQYVGAPAQDTPVMDIIDLIDQARADNVVEEVMKRYKAAMEPVQGMGATMQADPFKMSSGGMTDNPFAQQDPMGDGGMLATSEGNPFAGDAETPFDAPSEYQQGQKIGISKNSSGPLIRAVRPGFEEFGKYGYPQLNSDPHSRQLINTLRRITRGAQ